MKIHGFNSALPPPDKGKGQKQNPQVVKHKQTDRIELSSGRKPEASYANRVSDRKGSGNGGSRIEHPASHISRLRLNTYNNIAGKNGIADLESCPRAEQPAPDRIESSPGTEPIETLSYGGRAEKLAEVQLRIATGYYDNPEHLEKLADLLIDRLNIGNAKGSDDVSYNRG